MKTYNQTNFFKHTFCEFTQINDFNFPENTNYKSKSESVYFYTDEGVFRKSNHWGRVANCRWKLISKNDYKNQQEVIGFANWSDFYPINSSEKIFSIDVNYTKKTTKLTVKKNELNLHLYTFTEAQKKIKQITHLFKDDKWTKHFDIEINDLKFQVISNFINSDKTIQQIKKEIII